MLANHFFINLYCIKQHFILSLYCINQKRK